MALDVVDPVEHPIQPAQLLVRLRVIVRVDGSRRPLGRSCVLERIVRRGHAHECRVTATRFASSCATSGGPGPDRISPEPVVASVPFRADRPPPALGPRPASRRGRKVAPVVAVGVGWRAGSAGLAPRSAAVVPRWSAGSAQGWPTGPAH
jgi:hypothetical protein